MCDRHIVRGLRDGRREQHSFRRGTHFYYCRIPFYQKQTKGIHTEKVLMAARPFDPAALDN